MIEKESWATADADPRNLKRKRTKEATTALFSQMISMRAQARLRSMKSSGVAQIIERLTLMGELALKAIEKKSQDLSCEQEMFTAHKKELSLLIDGAMGEKEPAASIKSSALWDGKKNLNEPRDLPIDIPENERLYFLQPQGVLSVEEEPNLATFWRFEGFETYRSIHERESEIFQIAFSGSSQREEPKQCNQHHSAFVGSISYYCHHLLPLRPVSIAATGSMMELDPRLKKKKELFAAIALLEPSCSTYLDQYSGALVFGEKESHMPPSQIKTEKPVLEKPSLVQCFSLDHLPKAIEKQILKALQHLSDKLSGKPSKNLPRNHLPQSLENRACLLIGEIDPCLLYKEKEKLLLQKAFTYSDQSENSAKIKNPLHRSAFWTLFAQMDSQSVYRRKFVSQEQEEIVKEMESAELPFHRDRPQAESEVALGRVSDLFDSLCTIGSVSEARCALELIQVCLNRLRALSALLAENQEYLLEQFHQKSRNFCEKITKEK